MAFIGLRSAVCGGAVLIAFGGFVPMARAQIVDQEQPEMDYTSVGDMTLGGPGDQRLAQVVTAGQTGLLVAAEFALECRNYEAAPAGVVTLDLAIVEAGMPGAVVLTTTFDPVEFPGYWPYDWPPYFRRLMLGSPVPVTTGSQYALVLRFTSSNGTICGVVAGPEGDPYVGGDGWYDDIEPWGWAPLGPRRDIPFRTLMQEPSRISVWHKDRQWICIDRAALQAHQGHGDTKWVAGCFR